MWLVILTLLIPLLGIGLLLVDAWRQTAFPFHSRLTWTVVLRSLGGLAIIAAAGLLTLALAAANDSLWSMCMIFPLYAGLAVVMTLTGIQTFRVPRSWPGDEEDWDQENVIDRCSPTSLVTEPRSTHLRSGAWLMTLYPLFFVIPIIGIFGVFFLIVGAIVFGSILQTRRAFQSQLLWLLAVSTRNHLPLVAEFRSLAESKGVKLKRSLKLAAKDLEQGDALSMALERHRLLPAATIAAIRVSEGGSRLEETLRRLAVQSTERLKIFNISQLGETMTQVFVLLAVVSAIASFIAYFIVPKLKEIFDGFGVELPLSTQLAINMADHVVNYSTEVFFWYGIVVVFLVWYSVRHLAGWSSLSVPILMHWFPARDAPEVLRSLAGIAREGASFPERMQVLFHRPGRPDLGARYQRMTESMSQGLPLSESLFRERIINSLQRESIAAAERGGHLELILFSLAESLEQREFRSGAYWAELIKPLAIVMCGIVTAFVVIAMFTPLVKLLHELS